MQVDFTTNAQARMQDRGVAEDDVRAALESPDCLRKSFENHWHVSKRIQDRTLEVLFLRSGMEQRVVTAYWQET